MARLSTQLKVTVFAFAQQADTTIGSCITSEKVDSNSA